MYDPPQGMPYRQFLNRLHGTRLFDWYLEIGCRSGKSFAEVRSKTIAVDPFFQIERNVIGTKPQLHIFQQGSDDFFAGGFLVRAGIRLSVSFIDGMHLFEYALRDFMNVERNSDPAGVVFLHDCVPSDAVMTTRDLDNLPEGPWTGDVWKILPVLAQHRPDLTVTVLDCKPTGLVMVTGLNPKDESLHSAYETIVSEWTGRDIDSYGPSAFFAGFCYTSAKRIVHGGFAAFDGVTLPSDAAIAPEKITP
jgi:hypothetical protein